MIIRQYIPEDCAELAELFYNTVHCVNIADYSPEQINAWADGNVDLETWNKSFMKHYTLVAIIDNIIAGFADMDYNGYLDKLYVHKYYKKKGIATALCNALEVKINSNKFTVYASATTKVFFEKENFYMEKVPISGLFTMF